MISYLLVVFYYLYLLQEYYYSCIKSRKKRDKSKIFFILLLLASKQLNCYSITPYLPFSYAVLSHFFLEQVHNLLHTYPALFD